MGATAAKEAVKAESAKADKKIQHEVKKLEHIQH